MCGIAAIIGREKNNNFTKCIKKMTEVIHHRGPDSEGIITLADGKVVLGHRRLSILDLSSLGKQPMSFINRYWITYNGEVYNYKELKAELEEAGYTFCSNTDTEVIMAAYDYWGESCLHKFNGMWAFVLVDLVKNTVFVARDRFGIKPLYYWHNTNNDILFASEIKQFTVCQDWQAKLNGQRAYDYLRWGQSDHTNETLFKDVYQIRAGEAVKFELTGVGENKELPIYKWYNLEDNIKVGKNKDIISEFCTLFYDAVNLRLRSDVSVGSCLSGGLDSSSIVCTVNDILQQKGEAEKQYVVSAGAHIKKYDESDYINTVIKERNIKGHMVYPEMDKLFQIIDSIIWKQDEPFGSTSIFAQWNVFDCAKHNNLKVMLDGQGADEQLAGYHAFFAPYFTTLFKQGKYNALLDEINYSKKMHGYSVLFAIKGILSKLLPEGICNIYRTYISKNDISPSWINMKKLGAKAENPFINAGAEGDNMLGLSIAQLTASNLQKLLHWEDRDSMAHSVESRLPFLDYRLVEFILGIPDEYKIRKGVTKFILREAMRGVLPEKIRLRMDKMGFVTPEEYWMRENTELFRMELQNAINNSEGILTEKCIDRFNEIITKKRPFDSTIWRMICFGRWMKCFKVS